MANPLLIQVTRDPETDPVKSQFVESVHRGAIAVVDAGGRTLYSVGNTDFAICPRSTLKPLQALAFLESGAIEEFELGPAEIALSTASHNGEARHTQIVAEWLKKIDCTIDQLECGAHLPMDRGSADSLARAESEPSALHNNCSGKHAGFMSVARVMGVDVAGYTKPDHPVQVRIAEIISEMVGLDITAHRVGADGCAAPNYAIPLTKLAHGLAKMSRTQSLSPSRARAVTTLLSAVEADPFLIAGTGRPCTRLIPLLRGGGLVKSGAEGVYGAILPGLEIGVALKIDDGAGRAAEMVMALVLQRLGALKPEAEGEVADLLLRKIINVRGDQVGTMGPTPAWQDFALGA